MNKSILTGRMVADPEIRYANTSSGQMAVARFSVAVPKLKPVEGQTADFIRCAAFGKTAELVEKYCHKGNRVGIEGHIQTSTYIDKNGQNAYSVEVIVDRLEFLENKAAATNPTPAPTPIPTPTPVPEPVEGGFVDISNVLDDEEMPFI